ncbi:MAG TPA: cytochrome P450, partial [Polyangiales bacterium]
MRPPGPEPVTLHPRALLRQWRRMQRDPLQRVRERFERYGDVYRIAFLERERFVLRHPEHLRQVLIEQASCFEKPSTGPAARQLQRFLGQGLLTSDGELWRRQRRLIQPAFQRDQLSAYADVVVAESERVAGELRDGQQLDLSARMMQLTFQIVTACLFGRDASSETERVADAMRVFRETFDGVAAIAPRWLPTPSGLRAQRSLRDLDRLMFSWIDAPTQRDQDALLSRLTRSLDGDAAGMGRRQLRDELLTLLLAGHETTSHALSWSFYLLAQHPECESRLHAELDGVLGGRAPRWDDLPALRYAEQVLSEALRLYPPAYVVLRTSKQPARVAGYDVPVGTDMVLWIYHTHHDPRWHAEPERFVPERFAPERRRALPDCAYLPFGAGTRTCIGKSFALMEA